MSISNVGVRISKRASMHDLGGSGGMLPQKMF